MKTQSTSFFQKSAIAIGIFGLTALTTYGAVSNGGILKSTPYQTRNAVTDQKLATLTNGKGNIILDGVVAKIQAKATEKGGAPLNTTAYNAYIDNRLSAIDTMDNEVRAEYGTDYAFLFQYLYPRVYELKKTDNTSSVLNKIVASFSEDSTASNIQTSATASPTPATPTSESASAKIVSSTSSNFYVGTSEDRQNIVIHIDKSLGYTHCTATLTTNEDYIRKTSD